MGIAAGVDFGTSSVRVSIFDKFHGRLASGIAEYPVKRKADDNTFATQSHCDQLMALELAMSRTLRLGRINGKEIRAIAIDATGSTVIPVGKNLEPLDDYYLWCDHRASREAREITEAAREQGLEALDWCGGTYSSEWGFSKLLHWLRNNPAKRREFVTAVENCDLIVATLCGVTSVEDLHRSVCAMGHKWLWNPKWGGFPSEEFFRSVDPILAGIRDKLGGHYQTSDQIAGNLSKDWADRLGMRAGIPIPVGALDAHWDAVGSHIGLGDVVNVIGTSTCIIGVSQNQTLVPGVCGVVSGSVLPGYVAIEAGLSAVGDIFEGIADRAGVTVSALAENLDAYRAGQTGLLRFPWDNGDRTILVNPDLSGVTLGWNRMHTAKDELFAAIEGTAFHTRIILEHMEAHGTPVLRIINGGGIPQRNRVLNRIYANVLNKPVLVPTEDVTSLGSAIFAFVAAGDCGSVQEAQNALCPSYVTFLPQFEEANAYDALYALFRELYFSLGSPDSPAVRIGAILPELRKVARVAQGRRIDES